MYINKNNSCVHKNILTVLSQIEFQENPSLYQNDSMDFLHTHESHNITVPRILCLLDRASS